MCGYNPFKELELKNIMQKNIHNKLEELYQSGNDSELYEYFLKEGRSCELSNTCIEYRLAKIALYNNLEISRALFKSILKKGNKGQINTLSQKRLELINCKPQPTKLEKYINERVPEEAYKYMEIFNKKEKEGVFKRPLQTSEYNTYIDNKIFSLTVYEFRGDSHRTIMSKFMSEYKGGSHLEIGEFFGKMLAEELLINKKEDLYDIDFLIPVPPAIERQRERGYSPSNEIAKWMSQKLKIPYYDDILRREYSTHARFSTVYLTNRSYDFDDKKIERCKGLNVAIVDDVCTTGKTLDACAHLFKKNNANKVYGYTFAQAETSRRRENFSQKTESSVKIREFIKYMMLNDIKNMGPVKIKTLIEAYGSIDAVFITNKKEMLSRKIKFINEKIVEDVFTNKEKKIEYFDKYSSLKWECFDIENAQILIYSDKDYPHILKKSKYAPPLLYTRGTKFAELPEKCIAIVGSRNPTKEGIEIAERLSKDFVNHGYFIASGMARGIDTAGHKSAIKNKGLTVAVLGCGVDEIYPPENIGLYNEILQNGGVISEYTFGTKISPLRLKKRNRIISGLSMAVIIVQSAYDGGAMNAYKGAKEEKKKILTVDPDYLKINCSGNQNIMQNIDVYKIKANYNINGLLSFIEE